MPVCIRLDFKHLTVVEPKKTKSNLFAKSSEIYGELEVHLTKGKIFIYIGKLLLRYIKAEYVLMSSMGLHKISINMCNCLMAC